MSRNYQRLKVAATELLALLNEAAGESTPASALWANSVERKLADIAREHQAGWPEEMPDDYELIGEFCRLRDALQKVAGPTVESQRYATTEGGHTCLHKAQRKTKLADVQPTVQRCAKRCNDLANAVHARRDYTPVKPAEKHDQDD